MHPEYDNISKYVVHSTSRKLTIFLIMLSVIITLLTIWFLPILDHFFSGTISNTELQPLEVTVFRKPVVPKIYQDIPKEIAMDPPVKFTEVLPKCSKKIFNPTVVTNQKFAFQILETSIPTDLNFQQSNSILDFTGLNLSGLVFNLDQVDVQPIALNRLQPFYPFRARRRGIEGEVLLSFVITAIGEVTQIKILDSKPEGVFDEFAVRAVKAWKFKPALKNGLKVPVLRSQSIKFGLK